jgi:hypothetical protein
VPEYFPRTFALHVLNLCDSHNLIKPVLNTMHLENLLRALAGAAFRRIEETSLASPASSLKPE